MRLRSEAKVGLIVFGGALVLLAVYWFLGGISLRGSTYPIYAIFPNAQKLDKGASARVAGVKVGVVSLTSLSRNRARVDILVENAVMVPKDSVARITAGGFIGDNYIEITPGKSHKYLKAGDKIRSITFAEPEMLLQQASGILTEMHKSTQGINQLLGDPKMIGTVKDTFKSLNDAAKSASDMAASANRLVEDAAPELRATLAGLANASRGAAKISAQLQDMIANDVRPNVRSVMKQARLSSENLNDTIVQARQLIQQITTSAAKLDKSLDRVDGVIGQTEGMMSNLKDASAGVKDIATDAELRENIKKTLKNAAEASDQLKVLMANLNQKFGAKYGPTPQQRAAVPGYGLSINSLWDTKTGNYRVDTNYTFLGGTNKFYRLGAYNVGENAKAIFQGGTMLNESNALRYGLYASRMGLGYDLRVGDNNLFSTDLYRPNDPQMELRGVFGIGSPLGVYVGIADLLHRSNRDVLLGVQYKQ